MTAVNGTRISAVSRLTLELEEASERLTQADIDSLSFETTLVEMRGLVDGLEGRWRATEACASAAPPFTTLAHVTSRRIPWLWRGYLPLGYLSIWSGESKLGKSLMAAHTMSAITRGELDGDHFGKPADVLLVASEDGIGDMWKPRLAVAGADLERVHALNIPDDWNVRDGMDRISIALDARPETRFVLVDAVLEHLPSPNGGEPAHSATFVRHALRPLRTLAQERLIAPLISTHPPKGQPDSFSGAYHGSGAWVQISRSCLLFGYHPDDRELPTDEQRRVMLRAGGNIGRDPGAVSFRITDRWQLLDDGTKELIPLVDEVDACDITARALLNAERRTTGEAPSRGTPKVDAAVALIRDYLKDGEPHPSIGPAMESDGYGSSTITTALRRAGARAFKKPGERDAGWFWQLQGASR